MSNETALSPKLVGKPNHILVVEDDVALRFVVAEWLRLLNYIVYEAATVDEAILILASPINVDLVVTDVQMPGTLNGFDLVDFIHRTIPKVSVVVVSAGNFGSDAKERKVAFFRKPYNFENLSSHIASLLGSTAIKSEI